MSKEFRSKGVTSRWKKNVLAAASPLAAAGLQNFSLKACLQEEIVKFCHIVQTCTKRTFFCLPNYSCKFVVIRVQGKNSMTPKLLREKENPCNLCNPWSKNL